MDFTAFKENKNATIQFSYPAVDNVIYNSNDSSFFLPNNSVAPNFSYTDATNNLYISGATIKGYISSSNIKSSTELVLEHQSVNSDKKFYVVIPLKVTTDAKSSLSKLKQGSNVSIDLNSDIKTNRSIYHYLSDGSTHVFVFETPIAIKPNTVVPQNTSKVPKTSPSQQFKITSNKKVEDEIVCGYSEDAETTPAKEDKKVTTILYSVSMFFINVVLFVLCLQLMTVNALKVPLVAFSGLAALVLAGLAYFKKSDINQLIVYGSLGVTAAIITILAFLSVRSESFITKWLAPLPSAVVAPIASATTAKAPSSGPSALSRFI